MINCLRKTAAVIAPPALGPVFFISAMVDFSPSKYFSSRGIVQKFSPDCLEAFVTDSPITGSVLHNPPILSPRAMTQAPVRVARSTMASTSNFSAKTRASARVSRPSASVLLTSMVLPLEAVRISPGCMAWPLIIFSVAAQIKWTSALGLICPIALAAPRVAAPPPMSIFMVSMPLPTPLMFNPPESKVTLLPTMASFLVGVPSGL